MSNGNEFGSLFGIIQSILPMLGGPPSLEWPWETTTGEGMSISGLLGQVSGALAPGGGTIGTAGVPSGFGTVVKSWSTGTAKFYMNQRGKIGCFRKNGVWREWYPAKHLVIPRNPRVGTLIRADKKIDNYMNRIARRAGMTRRRTTYRRPGRGLPWQYISPAEVKQLASGR